MFYLDKSFYPTSEFIKPFNLRHENLFIPICFTAIFISNAFVYVVLFFHNQTWNWNWTLFENHLSSPCLL